MTITNQDLAMLRAKATELNEDGTYKNAHDSPNDLIVRLLAHIDATEADKVRFRSDSVRLDLELQAALDAKEKAEAKAIGLDSFITEIYTAVGMNESHSHCEVHEKVAELQAIVDRLPKTADGVPVTDGKVLWRVRRGVAVSGPFVMRGDGEIYYSNAYECYSTPEAALAAKGGVK